MDFLELVKTRRSVREYLAKPVEQEKIERCLEAARLAPSACNAQPWRFITVDEPGLKDAVANKTFGAIVSFNSFVPQAPVIVAVVMERPNLAARIGGALKGKQFNLIDIGIATAHFCLQAAAEGLGTCILGWFDERAIKKLLGVPRTKRIGLLITLGYSKTDAIGEKDRKPMDEIRSYNK